VVVSSASEPKPSWTDPFVGIGLRVAAGGHAPARWFLPQLPATAPKPPPGRPLRLEIVSHCWRYAPFLTHQLNSVVRFPPEALELRVTVYHAASDSDTVRVLESFEGHPPEGVRWNWRTLPETSLFRRAIGRNEAALRTDADWIWFTDCDVLFRENCLDELAGALRGRTEHLVFPNRERVTPLLASDHPILAADFARPFGPDVDPALFEEEEVRRATGPLQIVHGDTARACGYCRPLSYYQKPVRHWAKAYEDRALRWLLRTPGTPVDVSGVHRIRHQSKGRYNGRWSTRIRQVCRRLQGTQRWDDSSRG